MAHIVIEMSANLREDLSGRALVDSMHQAAVECALFPLQGLRTRLVVHEVYRMADGAAENRFIHITVRLGKGRATAERQAAGDLIFSRLAEFTAELYARAPLALSLEFVEIQTWKKNNLH